jgi:hypothetical protein
LIKLKLINSKSLLINHEYYDRNDAFGIINLKNIFFY